MAVILHSIKFVKTNELKDGLGKSVVEILEKILCQTIGREGATQSYGWYHLQ
jgi:hypothetical protein